MVLAHGTTARPSPICISAAVWGRLRRGHTRPSLGMGRWWAIARLLLRLLKSPSMKTFFLEYVFMLSRVGKCVARCGRDVEDSKICPLASICAKYGKCHISYKDGKIYATCLYILVDLGTLPYIFIMSSIFFLQIYIFIRSPGNRIRIVSPMETPDRPAFLFVQLFSVSWRN
jgi:hypothetical protein